jgi:hypothetical protein
MVGFANLEGFSCKTIHSEILKLPFRRPFHSINPLCMVQFLSPPFRACCIRIPNVCDIYLIHYNSLTDFTMRRNKVNGILNTLWKPKVMVILLSNGQY